MPYVIFSGYRAHVSAAAGRGRLTIGKIIIIIPKISG